MSDEHYWKAFQQQETRRWQQQMERAQRIAEIEALKKKQVDEHLMLLERERQTGEQQSSKQPVVEQVSLKVDAYIDLLQRLALQQARSDLQRREALQKALQKLQEEEQTRTKGSPIERVFYEAWCKAHPEIELKRQYPILRYRLDFAHEATRTAIELDGHGFHSGKQDRNKDYARQHAIEDAGWTFIRFTGSQVFHDVEGCIGRVFRVISQRMAR